MLMNRVNPHVAIPGLLTPQTQEVPFDRYIGKRTSLGTLAAEKAYFTKVTNINSETLVGQQWGSAMAKQTYTLGQMSAPYYRISAYFEYNVDEQAKFEALSNGVALPNFLENLAKQGIVQRQHQGIVNGFDGAEPSQGILANATEVTFPADSNTNQTLLTYNRDELQDHLSKLARNVMDSTYGTMKPAIIASSTRVINYLKTAVIPLAQSQIPGGGVDSVAGLFGRVSGEWLGVGQVEFIADNLLEGDTADTILMIAPGMDNQTGGNKDMNLVGRENGITYNTWYDVAAGGLLRFDTPPSLGTYAAKVTLKMTPGVALRAEAVVKTTIAYS